MSTSPLDPQEIRAAAEVSRELGPEYDDALIAAFIDRVDRAVAARVEARLAEEGLRQPAPRDRNRRSLLKGVAIGVCAGALIAGVSIGQAAAHGGAQQAQAKIFMPGGKGPFGPGNNIRVVPQKAGPQDRMAKPNIPLQPAPKS